jgi:putative transposase
MARYTTFRFCLDPTVEQCEVLARHGGASRFAFNQCLRIVKTALTQRKTDPSIAVPWTGFDLINAFNAWKKTAEAGRVFTVDSGGVADATVTGLPWRREVCQQVFEEAAVDLGKGLSAWSDSRCGKRKGKRVGFPRFKKKTGDIPSFRLRNKHPKGKPAAIRVGDNRPRSVTLPGIGPIKVHDDTRRLRRMLDKNRAKVLFATISRQGGRWWISLNVEAADLHVNHQHRTRPDDGGGWVGVDRGLSAFLVAATADGTEVTRISDAPKALSAGLKQLRRLSKSAGPVSPSRRQRPSPFPASGIQRVGQDPRPARHRKPQRAGNAGQPPPRQGHLRCQLVRVRPDPGLQAGLARRPPRRSRSLVPLDPPMPRMRGGQPRDDAGRSSVHLQLRT